MNVSPQPEIHSRNHVKPLPSPQNPEPQIALILYGHNSYQCTGVTRHSVRDGKLGKAQIMDVDEVTALITSLDKHKKKLQPHARKSAG